MFNSNNSFTFFQMVVHSSFLTSSCQETSEASLRGKTWALILSIGDTCIYGLTWFYLFPLENILQTTYFIVTTHFNLQCTLTKGRNRKVSRDDTTGCITVKAKWFINWNKVVLGGEWLTILTSTIFTGTAFYCVFYPSGGQSLNQGNRTESTISLKSTAMTI